MTFRPRVFVNVAMTADGKIGLPDRRHVSLGSSEDHRRMSVLRRRAGAVVVGGSTFRAYPKPLVENPKDVSAEPPRVEPIWNVVVSRSLDLPVDVPAFSDERVRMVLVTSKETPIERARAFPAQARIERWDQVTPEAILSMLSERGVKDVLLESGGDLTSMFVQAGCLDEVYVTIVPRLLGGERSPTPLGGVPFAIENAPHLSLRSVEQVGDELFLHYGVLAEGSR